MDFAEEALQQVSPAGLIQRHLDYAGGTPACSKQEEQSSVSGCKEREEHGSWPQRLCQMSELLPCGGSTATQGHIRCSLWTNAGNMGPQLLQFDRLAWRC